MRETKMNTTGNKGSFVKGIGLQRKNISQMRFPDHHHHARQIMFHFLDS